MEENGMAKTMTVAGVTLEVEERGQGRPLLFLHGGDGMGADRPWLDQLAGHYRVIAPSHPGFGRSVLPDDIATVDDLAYLYLDLAAAMGLEDAVLAGSSFGGWIAAEMAVRSTARFSRLVLVDPLGIKVGGRNDRDIVDMHAMTRDQFLDVAWADPAKGRIDYATLPDTELATIARGREALALFGWKPYMHNPRLKRWLHRIDRPTLVLWGDKDRIIARGYVEGWAKAIPGAKLETIANAGHFPHWEQPDDFIARVRAFAGS
jgi:pimeloyl-ACP methyl ester carboxylesterase